MNHIGFENIGDDKLNHQNLPVFFKVQLNAVWVFMKSSTECCLECSKIEKGSYSQLLSYDKCDLAVYICSTQWVSVIALV